MGSLVEIFGIQIFPIIGNFFFAYLPFYFMNKIDRNIYKSRIIYVIAYILYATISSQISLLGSGLLNFLVLVIGMIFICHFLYNNSVLHKIYCILFSNCIFLFDGLAVISIELIATLLQVSINNLHYYLMIAITLIRLTEYLYTKLAIIFINRRRNDKLSARQVLGFCIVPLFSSVYMFTLLNYITIYARRVDLISFLVNATLLVLLNLYVLYMFDNISMKNLLKNEVSLYQQQLNLQYRYYDNLEIKYQESRKLAHDIRNHLNTLEELYKDDDIERAREYTNDIHNMLNKLNQKYYTSNRVLNIILNDKISRIKNEEVDVEIRIGDVELDFIRDIDITTIFTNLLDNSIEAISEIKNNKYIRLDISKFNELLVINISNSMEGKPLYKGKKLKSTKENHSGLGIENIKKAIKKYDGNLSIDYTQDEFKVSIIIPI